MLATIKAEFRKLLTIRSTYAITILSLLLIAFIAFWGMGWHGGDFLGPTRFQSAALNLISVMGIFSGIVAILLVTHEYRYNTISYTLTASNSRLKVMLAKMLVLSVYAVIATALVIAIGMAGLALGAHMNHVKITPQNFDVYSVAWRSVVYMITSVLAGLVFGFLSRSVVFAIVAYFAFPSTVEPLLHNLVKVSSNYLPFMAQNQIISSATDIPGMYSPLASLGVFCAYLGAAWIVATVLFVKRDAN